MTEWEKFKVTELKEECKARQISITGLKLKQQYIDKLVEYEASSQDENGAEASLEEKTNGVLEEVDRNDTEEQDAVEADNQETEDVQPQTAEEEPKITLVVETDTTLSDDRPAALKAEDSRALVDVVDEEQDEPVAKTEQEAREIEKADMLIPQPEQLDVSQNEQAAEVDEDQPMQDIADDAEAEAALKQAQEQAKEEPTAIVDHKNVKAQSAQPDQSDESRKRKRRSITPPPNADEIQKKAKAVNGESFVTKRYSRSRSPKGQDDERDANHIDEEIVHNSPSRENTDESEQQQEKERPNETFATRSRSSSINKDSNVEPALHTATRSLYMRNFKRPLNIQSLRSHVSTIAQGSSSVPPGEDPIRFWHMNNIRSHAFVTFSSISAASRVRSAMHETRFPYEPQREPLWIDFVPEDKVEDWIEQETSAGRRTLGRNSGGRFEVAYNDTGDGIEAVFREFDPSSSQAQRPSIGALANNQSSISQRQASYNADPSKTAVKASAIHPDRLGFMPQSPSHDRRHRSPPRNSSQSKPHSDRGTGFKALDELFSSTATKPKLYFKVPPQDVIDERLDMIRDLFSDRGVTGDPGMKRYTFERDRSRQTWVDNGPEFGHGRKGQERLAGVGARGRGGYRGRSGGGRFYGGDSYRGGGRM